MRHKLVIWGVGEELLTKINKDLISYCDYFVDNNKDNQTVLGKAVLNPTQLLKEDKDNLIIMISSLHYYSEISLVLKKMGFIEGVNYIDSRRWRKSDEFPEAYSGVTWKEREEKNEIDFENNNSWNIRSEIMCNMALQGNAKVKSIMDLGCGASTIKQFIDSDIKYFGVDYKKRTDDTIVCDFNLYQFPSEKVDIVFVGGCLEYIDDVDWFIEKIANATNCAVLSYCSYEASPDILWRRSKGWVNHFTITEIIDKFQKKGFLLKDYTYMQNIRMIIKFERL